MLLFVGPVVVVVVGTVAVVVAAVVVAVVVVAGFELTDVYGVLLLLTFAAHIVLLFLSFLHLSTYLLINFHATGPNSGVDWA
jgi:hypothetical protein